LIYDNVRYAKFIAIFQATFIVGSVTCFFYVLQKLRKFPGKDWMPLHKWILALLAAQALLDDPFYFLNYIF